MTWKLQSEWCLPNCPPERKNKTIWPVYSVLNVCPYTDYLCCTDASQSLYQIRAIKTALTFRALQDLSQKLSCLCFAIKETVCTCMLCKSTKHNKLLHTCTCLLILCVSQQATWRTSVYLLASSHTEVLELVDGHLPITVPDQDTVCPFGKQQGRHVHTSCSIVHNDRAPAERKDFYFADTRFISNSDKSIK